MEYEDFDIDSLAEYLHLMPAQVTKMAERGTAPGRRVAGQWRFSRADIHHWLEDRIGVLGMEELERLENRLSEETAGEEQEYTIAALMPLEAVAVPLAARTRSSVITSMCELAAGTGLLWDMDKMAEAVRQREDLYPTALDTGVALLHPRRPLAGILAQPLLACGRTETGIPFASGGTLVDLFFLICSTDDRGHLQTLARLSRLLADPNCLAELRSAEDARALREALVRREGELK